MTRGATMPLDDISATMTHVMWCEEYLWNVSVLQRVHFSNLVVFMFVSVVSLVNAENISHVVGIVQLTWRRDWLETFVKYIQIH
jgi:hypothetical protein